jgi:hypothetical protein
MSPPFRREKAASNPPPAEEAEDEDDESDDEQQVDQPSADMDGEASDPRQDQKRDDDVENVHRAGAFSCLLMRFQESFSSPRMRASSAALMLFNRP